ncbi:MAG TPA: hypothetical protein VGI68_14685 [Mycobacterium sp.]
MPIVLTLIAVTTFVLLFALTGSALVPLKMLALNVISLSTTFGAQRYIAQHDLRRTGISLPRRPSRRARHHQHRHSVHTALLCS